MSEIDYPQNNNIFFFGIFEIHRKFAEIGRFEYGNVPENPKSVDFVDFPLHSLYLIKGNQANLLILDSQEKIKLKSTYLGEFWMDLKKSKIFHHYLFAGNPFLHFINPFGVAEHVLTKTNWR